MRDPAQAFGDFEECGLACPFPCVVAVGEAAGDTVPLGVGEGVGLGDGLACRVLDGAAVADWPGVVAPADAVPPSAGPPPAEALPPVPLDDVGAPVLESPPVSA
jgi:hypothetical protein